MIEWQMEIVNGDGLKRIVNVSAETFVEAVSKVRAANGADWSVSSSRIVWANY